MTIHLDGLTLTLCLLGWLTPCFWDVILIIENRRLKRDRANLESHAKKLERTVDYVIRDLERCIGALNRGLPNLQTAIALRNHIHFVKKLSGR